MLINIVFFFFVKLRKYFFYKINKICSIFFKIWGNKVKIIIKKCFEEWLVISNRIIM